ncbi:MAG: hypothetical protein COU47_04185 [Candidatus Niyogibacteria bacterium CG10_big_fil_rev_8_21_14_0_10_46_36]|uniref:Doxx family protein n=1 Tax=Candidatus Niyogibacteria bacterium CG10_big_fil_rev_8_21_14_0_10_46_36 TaxID=1974726 RepID=A0A2H0TE74_9BACT|nr:MAG: hypothetical protein COU47_04185 [Candidatus Niyogibacteria bacterium CG10_big_fil_rev_8_21_14_0_10_46_36]
MNKNTGAYAGVFIMIEVMAQSSFSKTLSRYDGAFVRFCKREYVHLLRIALFLVYFWFGFLKAIDLSPAHPLVQSLFERTIHFMPYDMFYVLFAIFEMVIGILFLMPKLERVALTLLALHLVTTVLPLFLLPETTWQGLFIPTLEGQYIIKNVLIIAAAIALAATLSPARKTKTQS